MTTYRIVRFTFDDNHPDNHRTIVRGLSLAQAQAHCSRGDTHGDGWFDGYTEETEEDQERMTNAD